MAPSLLTSVLPCLQLSSPSGLSGCRPARSWSDGPSFRAALKPLPPATGSHQLQQGGAATHRRCAGVGTHPGQRSGADGRDIRHSGHGRRARSGGATITEAMRHRRKGCWSRAESRYRARICFTVFNAKTYLPASFYSVQRKDPKTLHCSFNVTFHFYSTIDLVMKFITLHFSPPTRRGFGKEVKRFDVHNNIGVNST